MKLTANDNTAPGGKTQAPPAGMYLCEIQSVKKALSKVKATPYLAVRFKITAGPQIGKRLFDRAYLTESATWRIINLMLAAGHHKGTELDTDDPTDLMNKFQGRALFVTTADDEYNKMIDGKQVVEVGYKVVAYDSTEAQQDGADEDEDEAPANDAGNEEAQAEIPL